MLHLIKLIFCLFLIIGITLSDEGIENPNFRIINGVYASRFPFMASIHLQVNSKTIEVCTGSIVHRLYVLTSSTCVNDVALNNKNYNGFVRTGTLNLNDNGTTYVFNSIIQHPLYDNFQRRHDIALVLMKTPIEFNQNVQMIEINFKYIRGGKRCYTAGWGPYDSHLTKFSETLRWIADETSNVFQCVDFIRFTGYSVKQLHWDETLCVKNLPRGGMCRSDYGAPLIFNKTVVGVFSWGPQNCTTENKFPYVFTRTSFYRPFFRKYLN